MANSAWPSLRGQVKENKKLSCCCDRRSYILHDRLKKLLRHFCFNAIHCDRSVSSSLQTKRGTEPGVHKLLANYQSGGYKCRIGWIGRIRSRSRPMYQPLVYEHTH